MSYLKVSLSIIVLLSIILGLSYYTSHNMNQISKKIDLQLEKISIHLMNNDFEAANKELSLVKKNWTQKHNVFHMLIDHVEIESIDKALIRLSIFTKKENSTLALAEAELLKNILETLSKKDTLRLINIL